MMNATTETPVVEPAKRSFGFKKNVINCEQALVRLRELAKVREVIEQKYKAALAEAKKFQSECEDSWRAFLQNPFSVDLRKVALLRVEGGVAAEIFAHLYRRGTWVDEEFLRATDKKELRSVLLAAAKHKLAQAQQSLDTELKRAEAALVAEGFDHDQILQSPRVKSAQWGVERFERVVDSISSSKEEHLWKNASALLEN